MDLRDFLLQGVRTISKHIGKESERFAMHVKGMEFPGYEPRGGFVSAFSYAVSPRGACHRRAWPPAKEILGGYDPFTIEGKALMTKETYDENCILHSLLVCDFPAKFIPLSQEDYAHYFEAVTGEAITKVDFAVIADRIETLIRMFNNREGFTREDDTLPKRTLSDPLPDGPAKGKCVGEANLKRMIDEYYEARGWDSAGIPKRATIKTCQIETDQVSPG